MTDRRPESAGLPFRVEEAVLILEQADLATQGGVPLAPGLRAMAAETVSPRVRRGLLALANRLDAGESFPSVLTGLQPQLSPMLTNLLEHGSNIRRLDTILHWAATEGRRRQTLRWRLWGSLAYPILLTTIAGVVASALLLGIAPMFANIYDGFGLQIPPITRLVVQIARWGTHYWRWLVYGIVPVAGTLLILLFMSRNWLVRQRWSAYIPLIGPLFRLESLAEFCHLLAVFIEIHLPLSQAIRLAGASTSDLWLRSACNTLAEELETGRVGTHSAALLGIPMAIGQLLCSSSSPDSLAESLHGLGDLYAARVEVNSHFITVIIEPFILTLTTLSIGMIVVALYLPLIKFLFQIA
jgi:type II secretory pathway component PulF